MNLPYYFEIMEPLPTIHLTIPNGERHSGQVLSTLNGVIHYKLHSNGVEHFIHITAINNLNFTTVNDHHVIRMLGVPSNSCVVHKTLDNHRIGSKTNRYLYRSYESTFGKVV